MSQSRNFLLSLTALFVLQILAPASASAFPLKKCVDWLVSSTSKDSQVRPNEGDYQRFLYERNHNPQLNPPIAYFTPDTSDTDLLLAVEYWWYPHNIWHQTISDEYSELIGPIHAQQETLGFKVPGVEELLTMELALKIHELEEVEKKAQRAKEEQLRRDAPPTPKPPSSEGSVDESQNKPGNPWDKPLRDSGRSASPVETPSPTPSFDSSTPSSFGNDSSTF